MRFSLENCEKRGGFDSTFGPTIIRYHLEKMIHGSMIDPRSRNQLSTLALMDFHVYGTAFRVYSAMRLSSLSWHLTKICRTLFVAALALLWTGAGSLSLSFAEEPPKDAGLQGPLGQFV